MSDLSDKVLGWTMSTVGAGGVLAGIGSIVIEPNNIFGYAGAIGAAGCLGYGIDYLKRANSTSEQNR